MQTIAQNIDQELLFNDNNPKGVIISSVTPAATFPFPNLTIGSQYTAQLRITLSAAGTLTVSNGWYEGVGTGDAPFHQCGEDRRKPLHHEF